MSLLVAASAATAEVFSWAWKVPTKGRPSAEMTSRTLLQRDEEKRCPCLSNQVQKCTAVRTRLAARFKSTHTLPFRPLSPPSGLPSLATHVVPFRGSLTNPKVRRKHCREPRHSCSQPHCAFDGEMRSRSALFDTYSG